jgi:hypothetical protein
MLGYKIPGVWPAITSVSRRVAQVPHPCRLLEDDLAAVRETLTDNAGKGYRHQRGILAVLWEMLRYDAEHLQKHLELKKCR